MCQNPHCWKGGWEPRCVKIAGPLKKKSVPEPPPLILLREIKGSGGDRKNGRENSDDTNVRLISRPTIITIHINLDLVLRGAYTCQ